MACFLQKWGRFSTRDFIREIKALDHATVKKIKAVGPYSSVNRHFGLGFEHIKVNVQNSSFFILQNLVWLFMLHLIDLYSQQFQNFEYNNIILLL
jgi:hypothetical protein